MTPRPRVGGKYLDSRMRGNDKAGEYGEWNIPKVKLGAKRNPARAFDRSIRGKAGGSNIRLPGSPLSGYPDGRPMEFIIDYWRLQYPASADSQWPSSES
jgi:hypothetical protein